MKILTYICTKDVPTLGMIKGRKYNVNADSSDATVFASLKDCFEEMVPDNEKWHVGDIVFLSGRFTNITHPNKNRPGSAGEQLDRVIASITNITTTNDGNSACITFTTDGGVRYVSQVCSIRKSECVGDPHVRSSQKIVMAEIYWFINSRGIICRAIAGKDEVADRWRKISNNYYKTNEECKDYYQRILTMGSSVGNHGYNHLVIEKDNTINNK